MVHDIIAIISADREKVLREILGLTGLCVVIIAAMALPALV